MKKRDYYSVLGVERGASAEEIKRAYRSLAKQFHPDMNPGAEAARLFGEIDEAHDTLIDPETRRIYDRTLPPDPAVGQTAPPPNDRSQGMQGAHGVPPNEYAGGWTPQQPQRRPQRRWRDNLDPRLVTAYSISVGCAVIPMVIAHRAIWYEGRTFDSLGELLRFVGGIGLLTVVIYCAVLLIALTACRSLGAIRPKSDKKKPISVGFLILMLFDLGIMTVRGGLTEFMGISGAWGYFAAYAILFAAFLFALVALHVVSSSGNFRTVWSKLKQPSQKQRRRKRDKRFDAPKVILILVAATIAIVLLCALLPSEMQAEVALPVILIAGFSILAILRVDSWRRH
jgi:hypothetical protein